MSSESGIPSVEVDRLVGGRLKLFRTGVGLSIDALAAAVGVPIDTVERWESGIERISSEHIFTCGQVLHVHLGEFFDEPDPTGSPAA